MPTPFQWYRVLFSDGATLDVVAHTDSSTMRGWAYERHYGRKSSGSGADRDRIEGVAHLGLAYVHDPDTDAPVSQVEDCPPKKPTRKKATDVRPGPDPAPDPGTANE